MNADQVAAILPEHSMLAACSRAELAALIEHASIQPIRVGDVLLEQGDEGDSLVLLLDGVARVSMVAANGREIILDYAESGAVLGEIALLDGNPRTASAVTITPGRALRLSRAAFEDFIERHPKVAIRMMRDMAKRLRQANDTIESDRACSAGQRLARTLRRLMRPPIESTRLRHDLSQSELGNFVGISRENVNRQLSAWVEAGVIEMRQGRIRILDRGYIEEVAEAGV
jgi:CRP/FNR family cyclic AMP-dependent transcriptional regulator